MLGGHGMGEWLPPGSGALPHSLILSPCSSALMESLINPLQDRIEDWKKTANQLDKDHAKGTGEMGWIRAGWRHCWAGGPSDSTSAPPEYKRARHEIKKKSSDTLKLQKKARKGERGSPGGRPHQPFHSTPSQGRYPGCGTANRGVGTRGVLLPPHRKGGAGTAPGVRGGGACAPAFGLFSHVFSVSFSLPSPPHPSCRATW